MDVLKVGNLGGNLRLIAASGKGRGSLIANRKYLR